ncbi:MAG: hypothetical protein HY272_10020 [Gammaproteobacteria bacterium]|nr:hypothetical protein [Gammaproteobacteria bacterium]
MSWKYALTVLGLLGSNIVAANVDIDSSLSLRGDAWNGDRDLNDEGPLSGTSAWGKAKVNSDALGQLVVNGWVRTQSSDVSRHGLVRELYWRNHFGPLDVKLGRQMIAWGRADGLNPTDYLSPRDFTLLVTEDADMRYGNESANVALETRTGLWSVFWFPQAASNTIPLATLPGVAYRIESPPESSQWALKWEGSSENIDGSLSYFNGFDPTPDLLPGGLSAQGLDVVVRNQRAKVIGGDVSWVHEGVIWRAESAWLQTDSEGRLDFSHKKPQLWLVGGPEWSFGEGGTFGIQATVRHVYDFSDPESLASGVTQDVALRQAALSGQTAQNQEGFTWRIAKRWLNDSLTLETTGVAVWPDRNGTARVKLDYAINDDLRILLGTDHYFGPEYTYFGQLQRNRLIYLQLRYGL